MTYAEDQDQRLSEAREEYNRLYPDAPIARLGDTPERFFLLDFDDWRDGENPIDPAIIGEIEYNATETGGFS